MSISQCANRSFDLDILPNWSAVSACRGQATPYKITAERWAA
jgi:hypothetical protein